MSTEQIVLLYAFMGILMTTFLIFLNNIKEGTELLMKEPIDLLDYIKYKSNGDEIDRLIAEKLEIDDIAA